MGNVRATVDQSGAVIGYDDFYPYGQVMPGRSSNTANANDIYKFTGHERDAELGLDYMLARNYDPEIGRFLSVDPELHSRRWLSPYNYSSLNPTSRIDRTGALDEWYLDMLTREARWISDKGGSQTDYYSVGRFLSPNVFAVRDQFEAIRDPHFQINSFRFDTGYKDGGYSYTRSIFHSPTDNFTSWFLERGGPDHNIDDGSGRRIPSGLYKIITAAYGNYPMQLVADFLGRTEIKIHAGNNMSETEGCPMPQSNINGKGGSKTKTKQIFNAWKDAGRSGSMRVFNVSNLGGSHSEEDKTENEESEE